MGAVKEKGGLDLFIEMTLCAKDQSDLRFVFLVTVRSAMTRKLSSHVEDFRVGLVDECDRRYLELLSNGQREPVDGPKAEDCSAPFSSGSAMTIS